jgi:hypothetical protein
MFNLIILIMMSLAWASSYVVISTVELTLSPLSISASLTTVGAIVMVFIVRVIQRRPLLPILISNPVPLLNSAPGNPQKNRRRRVICTHWFGDDARYVDKKWECNPNERGEVLVDRGRLECSVFPRIF